MTLQHVRLCDLVSELAKLVGRQCAPLSDREAYLTFVLTGMPYFRDVKRLDIWETAFTNLLEDDFASETERLLGAIYELGSYNLYGAFSSEGTTAAYKVTQQILNDVGLDPPNIVDIPDW